MRLIFNVSSRMANQTWRMEGDQVEPPGCRALDLGHSSENGK